jgi:hypothetical protein
MHENGTRRVTIFARRYLEKLVNVEVPVPVPEKGQTRKLLAQSKKDLKDRSPAALLKKWVQFAVRRFGTIVLIAFMLSGGYYIGHMLGEGKKQQEIDLKRFVQDFSQKELAREKAKPREGDANVGRSIKLAEAEDSGHFVAPGLTGSEYTLRYMSLPMIAMITFIVVVILFGLFQLPPDPEVADSREFADALEIWHPWVIIKRQTPRSIKRYKNRVRYFAMRLRSDDEPQPAWKRLLQRLKESSADKSPDAEPAADEQSPADKSAEEIDKASLQEPLLVALGAIHHCNNHWVENDDLFKLVEDMKISELFDRSEEDGMHKPSQKEIEELIKAINTHANSFPDEWPPEEEQRRRFIKLSKGIRTF